MLAIDENRAWLGVDEQVRGRIPWDSFGVVGITRRFSFTVGGTDPLVIPWIIGKAGKFRMIQYFKSCYCLCGWHRSKEPSYAHIQSQVYALLLRYVLWCTRVLETIKQWVPCPASKFREAQHKPRLWYSRTGKIEKREVFRLRHSGIQPTS